MQVLVVVAARPEGEFDGVGGTLAFRRAGAGEGDVTTGARG